MRPLATRTYSVIHVLCDSRACFGGLPGPLVPGFLGELVTSYGKRKEGVGTGKRGGKEEKFLKSSYQSLFSCFPTI